MTQETTATQQIAGIAARTTLYPMLPQLLHQEDLEAIAGAQFGIELIGKTIYPEVGAEVSRFGGGLVDAAMRAKVQTWLSGWIEPPPYYLVHHPVMASGQWWRLFRTGIHMEADLKAAREDAETMPQEELEARYSHVLGAGARSRYESFDRWWFDVLATIRMGTWHAAIYSPRYKSFISPLVGERAENEIGDLRSEWPKLDFQLYATDASGTTFDLARLIAAGAFIEVLGDISPAPPFGATWGPGIQIERNEDGEQVVTGLIHAFKTEDGTPSRRVFTVRDAGGDVELDGPDPFRLLQAIYGATEWCPAGVPQECMAPEALGRLVEDHAEALTGPSGDAPLMIPKRVFLDAIEIHPGLVPVVGRITSLAV